MKTSFLLPLWVVGLCLWPWNPAHAEPPFWGTIYMDPDILTEADPTCYLRTEDAGRGERVMFDRRVNDWVELEAFLFLVHFNDDRMVEFQVNPEFGDVEAALAEVLKFAPVIGRLPACLRRDVATVWIHQGVEAFGGGNHNLLIHTGRAEIYAEEGILEEVFVHEAAHTSLDAGIAEVPEWIEAQAADGAFISSYAAEHPTREDVAESFLPWLAARHRAERIPEEMVQIINETIPNRLSYFDAEAFDLYPLVPQVPIMMTAALLDPSAGTADLTWVSQPDRSYVIKFSTDLADWQAVGDEIPSQGNETRAVRSVSPVPERAFFRVEEVQGP